jgi:hypothetical protein
LVGWLVVSSLFLGGGLLAQLARVVSSCSLVLLSFYNARGVDGSFYFFGNRVCLLLFLNRKTENRLNRN